MATSPSLRVARVWEDLQDFTVEELRWLLRQIMRLGEDPENEEEGGAGVREPRRPRPPRPRSGVIILNPELETDETQNFELDTPEERSTV